MIHVLALIAEIVVGWTVVAVIVGLLLGPFLRRYDEDWGGE